MPERPQSEKGEKEPNILKGLASGAIAGAAAGLVMSQVQTRVMPKVKELLSEDGQSGGGGQSGGEPATVKAAEAVSENLFEHELEKEEKKWAGPAAHYWMAITTGAIYGVAAEADERVTRGAGLPFGTAVWAVADEMVVPALGLSKPPQDHPPSTHAYALASHLVYGFTAEMVRERVRRAM